MTRIAARRPTANGSRSGSLTCRLVAAVLFVTTGGGCARYQFVLVEPVDRVIANDQRTVVSLDPLEYRLSSLEDEFLIVRISNPTDDVIRIEGDRTYVVDPDNETHALGDGILAPHASITLVFPPPPKVYAVRSPYGSRWRFGYDGWRHRRALHRGFGHRHYLHDPFYYDPFYDFPRTYYVTEYPPGYWEWKTGRVRLHFAYRRDDHAFAHELVVLRRKLE